MKKIILVLALSIVGNVLFAQDKIYTRKGDRKVINAKITEIGIEEIKYKEFDKPDGPQFVVEKDDIEKIVYEGGRMERFEQSVAANVSYEEMRKNIIKWQFLNMINLFAQPSLSLSYERGMEKGKSYEGHLTLIGLSPLRIPSHTHNTYLNNDNTSYYSQIKGVNLGASVKYFFTPDYVQRGMRSRHFLQGGYIRPSVYIGYKTSKMYADVSGNVGPRTTHVEYNRGGLNTALMAEIGKQWIMNNRMSLDLFVGVGMGYMSVNSNKPQNVNADYADFSFLGDFGNSNFVSVPLTAQSITNSSNYSSSTFAFNSGLRLGYLFHTKKEKEALDR